MNGIYTVTIHGKILESSNLRQLLARAVREKRSMDARLHIFARLAGDTLVSSSPNASPGLRPVSCQALGS
jgi:hypothetical protein